MPLQNGLYKIEFQTQLGAGAGVVILHDGQLRGGDSMIYYVGTYKQEGDEFSAEVRTDAHSHPPDITPVFGRERVNITIKGTIQGTSAHLTGSAAEAPGVSFSAALTRLGD